MSERPEDDTETTRQAMAFCLWEVIRDRQLRQFEGLLSTDIAGFGGDPGWEIERRGAPGEVESSSGTPWPPHAEFHASIDPGAGPMLAHPECFMTRNEFAEFALEMFANYFDDVHGKTVSARRALAKAREDAAKILQLLEQLRNRE